MAERAVAPVFSATASETVAGPVPDEPLGMVIHETGEDAVHEQSSPVATMTDRVDAGEPTETLLLDRVFVQTLPACVTLNAREPMVSVPTRETDVGFAAAVYCTIPSPCPDVGEVTVSQDAPLDTVQAQSADVVTATDALVPAAEMLIESGARLKVHAAPACVTVTVSPPTVMVPVLVAVPVFGVTL